MADIKSKAARSYNMSQIKGKNTKPEELVRKHLFANGFRYRKNDKTLPGSPDIVLPKYKVVVFVNGCFWHGHDGCRYFVWPKTNEVFWKEKIQRNMARDNQNYTALHNMGWRVLLVWECNLKPKKRNQTLSDLIDRIKEIPGT